MTRGLEAIGPEWRRLARSDSMAGRVAGVRVALEGHEGAALRLFASAPDAARFYWDQPAVGRAVCGVGALRCLEAGGAACFEQVTCQGRSVLDGLEVVGDAAPQGAGPLLVGGFAFDPLSDVTLGDTWRGFAPISFVLPEILYVQEAEQAWLSVLAEFPAGCSRPERESLAEGVLAQAEATLHSLTPANVGEVLRPPPATASEYSARPDRPHVVWLETVQAAIEEMASGTFEKVVLARSLGVETDVAYDPVSVLAALRLSQSSCTTFAVTRGEQTFLGASPERLLRLDKDRLETAALAGAAPRGRNPAEDDVFARGLLESKKEQEEHAFVVREIEAALTPLCDHLVHSEAPRLLALDAIQHLETPFEGSLRRGARPHPSLLEVAARLHPTPAVCGSPRDAASHWLRENEALERGWYAGGVGYFDSGGGGEVCVALRSGLLSGCSARLYAGAGLVAASSPEGELAETRLKLRTLLSQLTEI